MTISSQSAETSRNLGVGNLDADTFALEDCRHNWPRLWMAKLFHRGARGQRLEFAPDRTWQFALYKDNSKNITIEKAAQVGISEWAFCSVYAFAMRGQIVLYVLPSDADRNLVVPRRIDRTIERVPFYRENCATGRKASDMKSQKTLFGVDCMFLGSNSATAFFEKPADVLMIDEYDKCNHTNLVYAADRLASSPDPHVYKFGNPTISGYGIDAEYEKSDQKEWHLTCPHCQEVQPLTWFDNFVKETDGKWSLRYPGSNDNDASAVCRKCCDPIDRLTPGKWIVQNPESNISGYHISRLFGDVRSGIVSTLFDEWLEAQNDATKLQRFYNNVLGIPYDAKGSKITETDLSACVADYAMPLSSEGGTISGCDVGNALHVHISLLENGVRRKLFVGTVSSFEDLSGLHNLYNVNRGVIDAMPETRKAREFCRSHSGWYMCRYFPTDNTGDVKVDNVKREVQVDRTQSLDASHAAFVSKHVLLPSDWRQLDSGDFVKQMTAPTRVVKETARGLRYVWDEGSKPDHHRHADNYECIAARLFGGGTKIVTAV